VPVPGLAAGAALKPQQYPVVRFALAHRRVLIGDDMGWGKTLSSLAAVAADGAWPAVVVCRPSLTRGVRPSRVVPARACWGSRHAPHESAVWRGPESPQGPDGKPGAPGRGEQLADGREPDGGQRHRLAEDDEPDVRGSDHRNHQGGERGLHDAPPGMSVRCRERAASHLPWREARNAARRTAGADTEAGA